MNAQLKRPFTAPYDVVTSIERHLRRDDSNIQQAAKEYLDNCTVPELSRAMRDGDMAEVGRLLSEGTDYYLFMEADEIAEQFLAGDMTAKNEMKLRGWAPFDNRHLGKRYHLAEMTR